MHTLHLILGGDTPFFDRPVSTTAETAASPASVLLRTRSSLILVVTRSMASVTVSPAWTIPMEEPALPARTTLITTSEIVEWNPF